MTESRIIGRSKLFEQIAEQLEREILDGKLKPGDRLPPERHLRERFNVGRPAIREALIMLQRSGLIEIGNGVMHNPAFIALHDAMSTWLHEQRRVALAEPDEDRRSHEAHAIICEAVTAHDPDAAEAAMREHLESGFPPFWRRSEGEHGDDARTAALALNR